MFISAVVTEPGIIVGDYRTKDNRSELRRVLGLMSSAQYYVEVTPDGVTFVDHYLDVTERIQITPHKGEEFGPDDVIDILGLSPSHFGEQLELRDKVSGQLRHGHVFAFTAGSDPEWLGTTFKQIVEEDTVTLT